MVNFHFSIFNQEIETNAGEPGLVGAAVEIIRATGQSDRWSLTTDGFWCSVTPSKRVRPGQLRRGQGWKLHLSATPASAGKVLAQSLPVLLDGGCPFKFARTLHHVAQLNDRHTPRGHSGKFITVYPNNDEEAVRLAEELHQVTAGLAGPRILSDRPYAPDSLVHYRYGAFVEERMISNDGLYAWVIFDPDGNPVEDRRVGQYLPPAWARCPFPEAESFAVSNPNGSAGVLVADRFLVREAIRHVNKGSVYRAVDTLTGADAVIKEARPHVATDSTGKDVRDLLRAEARALERIGPLGAAPQMFMLFEHSRHLFLAEELVPGTSLREWVLDRIRDNGWRRHVPDALRIAERLAELMSVAHRAGLILRDFTPNNIMVRPDGQLQLIDLELAVVSGQQEEEVTGAGTLGYAAPEQMEGARAAVEADYFSLGATICFVVTGSTPHLMADVPKSRSLRERLAEWLAVRDTPDSPVGIRTLILGLMDDDPGNRWTTVEAREALAAARKPPRRRRTRSGPGHGLEAGYGRLDDEAWRQAVDGSVGYLLASMRPADHERLWPVSCAHGASDPCAVQLGAAGVLGVLTGCFELTGDQRLPEAVSTAGQWITRRLKADANRPPGLYFGEAGIAWALYEAGLAIGDDRLAEQGLGLAGTLPVSSPNPDVTHGTAGIGLTLLHFWLRTGNQEFVQRAGASADTLVTSATAEPGDLIWGTPAAFDSRLAGGRYYGFAHGTAGVGYFLLATALATGRSDCLALAHQAGETLLDSAVVVDGVALWGAGPGDDPTAPYWCHGSSGIGTFLIRLHRATGDDRFAKLADMSARAVLENSWRGVLGQCHGLAGNGDFLLDMAGSVANGVGGRSYEATAYQLAAHQLARVTFASRARREGAVVFPDERGDLSPAWADGVSGILAFLLRLRYRCARRWMVDSILERHRQP